MNDFALLGHVDSWDSASKVVNHLRGPEAGFLEKGDLREIFGWLPARPVFRVKAKSFPSGHEVKGVYIDTFITPDELTESSAAPKLKKIQAAAACAIREQAKVAVLGGFTSIALQGDLGLLGESQGTAFTTGNTLTAAFIVKGIEKAAAWHNKDLKSSSLLIIGSTGDLGSACLRYFAGRTGPLLLCARNKARLLKQQSELAAQGISSEISTQAAALLPKADIILLAASSGQAFLSLENCSKDSVICDAAYPSNALEIQDPHLKQRVFAGGMGLVLGGYTCEPELRQAFYARPNPHISHGCLLEGILLAMEGRHESFSRGRGQIMPEKIEEIWGMAQRHGLVLAPFFYQNQLWNIA